MTSQAMRVVRFISIGLGQGVALDADLLVLLLVIVVVYPAVRPARTEGGFAPGRSEMALVAFSGQIVTGRTILLGLVAVKLSPVFVKPIPANHVGFDFMAVMAAGRPGAIGAALVMAGVAHIPVFFKVIVAVLPVDPV